MKSFPQYYAAYGADLNMHIVTRWCEDHHLSQAEFYPYCKAYLPDYELILNKHSQIHHGGVLNLQAIRGQIAPVFLIEVNEIAVKALKKKAHASHQYTYQECVALTSNGQEVKVFTFLAPPEKQARLHIPPSIAYQELVLEGATELGLNLQWHRAAFSHQSQDTLMPGFFFYGTLKTDGENFHFLKTCGLKSAHVAKTEGVLVDVGAYPGFLSLEDENGIVWGEYLEFENTEKAILAADAVEEFFGFEQPKSLYRRALLHVEIPNLSQKLAWIYIYLNADPLLPIIEEGYWGLPPFMN